MVFEPTGHRNYPPPNRNLDQFSRFCTVHPCDTDTQTTLRVTSVAIGRTCAKIITIITQHRMHSCVIIIIIMVCKQAPGKIARHQAVNDTVARAISAAGVPITIRSRLASQDSTASGLTDSL